MKRNILIIFAVSMLVALSYSMSEAEYIADSPFTYSNVVIYPNFDGYGDTAVVTYESTDNLGSYFAFLLNPYGVPIATSATYNYVYLFADVLSDGSLAIYGSDSGYDYDWHRIF